MTTRGLLGDDGYPETDEAERVIRNALRDGGDPNRYPTVSSKLLYTYSSIGAVADASLGTFTLYGTLRTRLQATATTQAPLSISVWATPTRPTERPYQLGSVRVSQRA